MIVTSYQRLLAEYGSQHWWPAETAFEIMVGALLVQQTAWSNATKAIEALRGACLLECAALSAAPLDALQALIRPAGFYRMKAVRLKGLSLFVAAEGGIDALRAYPTPELRRLLLSLEGVGPETADSILLYAFERPVCVVDAYARRWYARMSGVAGRVDDARLRTEVLAELRAPADLNEFHALLVEHSKRRCMKRPRCEQCCLRSNCLRGQTPGSDPRV